MIENTNILEDRIQDREERDKKEKNKKCNKKHHEGKIVTRLKLYLH